MSSAQQHRRRISVPATPPETPLDGYFDPKQTQPPPVLATHITVYPDSPPVTPERSLPAQQTLQSCEKDKGKTKEQEQGTLPTHGPRRPSIAYAHHRRTSTATIIRLAAARQGVVLTPSKIVTLFLIVLSATYLASFIPGPLYHLLRRGSSRPHSQHAPTFYSVPTVSGTRIGRTESRTMPIGETAQRKAWEETFPQRIPPQQHVVPVRHDSGHIARSHDGDLLRAHPELLVAHAGAQPRRRPLRFGKAAEDAKVGTAGRAPSNPNRRDGADGQRARSDAGFDDASHSPRKPAVPAERKAQINRMKKMSAAKHVEAKVGGSVAREPSHDVVADAPIIVEAAKGPKRKVRNVKAGSASNDEAKRDAPARAKPRMGKKDRQVADDEARSKDKAPSVDAWAEMEDLQDS
ncbi:hypothetical protein JCM10212_003421 [Sporobolomyces blumeae]